MRARTRRQRRLAAALLATTIIAAGCTSTADDAVPPATALAPAAVPSTTAAPAALTDDEGAPQRDAYFALDRVLDVSIEIAVEDWDTLRHQTRTLADVFAEIEEYGLSRPFADIYTWFGATVTVDGQTHADVGVRKKGFVGSQSSTKPSLKLRFDKYTDGQSLCGVMYRMTLNNSVQDPSMVNTCLSYRVFAAAGNPAPRCNFANVSVNGTDLGLYVHVEEFKAPFLSSHFGNADGNLYEGTVSDFTPEFRGTIEKKTNEDADDWSDIDAVVGALRDSSDAGLKALDEIVDLDRFLSFWATEVLVGHWDGYAGDRNNYWFYREPDGRFVFMPWGTDGTFHLQDDPNPFDNISDPPPSVLALTAIPNRLYNHPDWRAKYVARLTEILDAVWDETELLAAVDEMAAIVQQHALPEEARAAAADTERVRTFILKRKAEILADLSPTPPDWPEPQVSAGPSAGSGTLEITFETTWGSNLSPNPLGQGTIHSLLLNGAAISGAFSGVYGSAPSLSGGNGADAQDADPSTTPLDVGLVINEVAAKGDPLDWFELHNASRVPIALDGFEMADSLTDAGKRVPFPAGTVIRPGAYMEFSLDKDSWPGFALGGDEELGIWLSDGTLVASVDWDEGQSGADQSYARVPDVTGRFETVETPTPGAANQP